MRERNHPPRKQRQKEPVTPSSCRDITCSLHRRPEPSELNTQEGLALGLNVCWLGLLHRKQVLKSSLCLIKFLSPSGSKTDSICKMRCYSTQPKVCVLESEMKEIISKDVWEVVKSWLQFCLWLFHLEPRWLPVSSTRASPSAACWLVPVGKYRTSEPLPSSGSIRAASQVHSNMPGISSRPSCPCDAWDRNSWTRGHKPKAYYQEGNINGYLLSGRRQLGIAGFQESAGPT